MLFALLIALLIIFSTHAPLIEVGRKNAGPFQMFITDFYALFAMFGLAALPVATLFDEDAGIALAVVCVVIVVCWLMVIWLLSRARIQDVKLRLYGQIWLPLQAALVIPMAVSAVVLLEERQVLSALLGIMMILISAVGAYFAIKKVAKRSPNNVAERSVVD